MEEGSETNARWTEKGAKGEELEEKCIGISIISHISRNEANAVHCGGINSSPVVIISNKERFSESHDEDTAVEVCAPQRSTISCGYSGSRNGDPFQMTLSFTADVYAPSAAEHNVHTRPRAARGTCSTFIFVWRSEYSSVKTGGCSLRGIEGAAHTSPENTELQLGQWLHLVELSRNTLLVLFFFSFFLFFSCLVRRS